MRRSCSQGAAHLVSLQAALSTCKAKLRVSKAAGKPNIKGYQYSCCFRGIEVGHLVESNKFLSSTELRIFLIPFWFLESKLI